MSHTMLALFRSDVFLAILVLAIGLPASLVFALRFQMRRGIPLALRMGAFFQRYGRVTFAAAFLVHAFGIFLSLGPWVRLLTALAALSLFVLWSGSGRAPSRTRSAKGTWPHFSPGA